MAKLQFLAVCVLASHLLWSQLPDVRFKNIDVWESAGELQHFRDVVQDSSGILWFTTSEGVYSYDNATIHAYTFTSDTPRLSSNRTQGLYITKSGNILVGTEAGSIDVYNKSVDNFESFISSESGIGKVFNFVEDQNGTLWIAGNNGIFTYSEAGGISKNLIPIEPPDQRGYGIRKILIDQKDKQLAWFGGLSVFGSIHLPSGKVTLIDIPFYFNNAPTPLLVLDLLQTQDGKLYCGTWGGALISHDPANNLWRQYNPFPQENRSTHNVIFRIRQDSLGRIWISTALSIGLFEPRTEEYSFYTINEDMPYYLGSSLYYYDLLITSQGNIIITRKSGFSISSTIYEQQPLPAYTPKISKIFIEDSILYTKKQSQHGTMVVILPEQRDLKFCLTLPGYFEFQTTQFLHYLEGYDRYWTQADAGNHVRYTNLPPNKEYTFRYKASIDGQEWLEGQPILIVKNGFFWQKWSFYLLIILLLFGIGGIVYYTRIRYIKKREALRSELIQQASDFEMRALRSQMNPHFIFNSLNSIKHFILTNKPLVAAEYLTDFATLIRATMHISAEKSISLSQELEILLLYIQLEQLRFKNKFEFKLSVEPDVDPSKVLIPPLILQPIVENAIWHGLMHKDDTGLLSINVYSQNSTVYCDVHDDGIGRERASAINSKSATRHKSMGMGITSNRIALYNRLQETGIQIITLDRKDAIGKSTGTTVKISIPAQSDDKITEK